MKLQEWLSCFVILMLGISIGLSIYRMSHEQPIVIQNHIPLCGK